MLESREVSRSAISLPDLDADPASAVLTHNQRRHLPAGTLLWVHVHLHRGAEFSEALDKARRSRSHLFVLDEQDRAGKWLGSAIVLPSRHTGHTGEEPHAAENHLIMVMDEGVIPPKSTVGRKLNQKNSVPRPNAAIIALSAESRERKRKRYK